MTANKSQIAVGSSVRLAVPPPPTMIVTDVHVDLEKLRDDPAHPVIVAQCEWETPEEEESMGPVRHIIFKPLHELEELAPPPKPKQAAKADATAKPTPKAHQGPKEDPKVGAKKG